MYDNNGNILKQRQFAFTLKDNTLIEELDSTDKVYIYEGDKLISYNGQSCVYDRFFNPTTYRGKAATWSLLRQLTSYNGHTFTYDGLGRRWSKDNIAYTYDADNRLIKQSDGLEFFYDHTGVAGVRYNNATYLYRKDALGNIIALINSSGNVVARYVYDAWGNHKVINTSGAEITDSSNIANLNPFRYRSYYYDRETKLYYLKSRYYDPEVGRFITIDDVSYLDPGAINGLNLYAYCRNNPVKYADPSGHSIILALLLAAGIGALVGATSYVVGEAVSSIITGEQFSWSWASFTANVLGGAIGGMLTINISTAPSAAGFAGMVTRAIEMILQNEWEGAAHTPEAIIVESLEAGLSGLVVGKFIDSISIKGLTTGRGSYTAIAKQIYTKLCNGTIKHLSVGTFLKMLAVGLFGGSIEGVFSGVEDAKDNE